jgi:hypothetical protein
LTVAAEGPSNLRAKTNFVCQFNLIGSFGPLHQKFRFRFSENDAISLHPALSGGALRPIVTNVGGGMRWTQRLRKTSAAGADGEIVWS